MKGREATGRASRSTRILAGVGAGLVAAGLFGAVVAGSNDTPDGVRINSVASNDLPGASNDAPGSND